MTGCKTILAVEILPHELELEVDDSENPAVHSEPSTASMEN